MFIPAGKPVHESLSTSYVNVRALFDEMQREKFTGYVRITFEVKECYVFFDKGQIVNALDSEGEHRISGLQAIDSTLAFAEKRRGKVGVYQHTAQIIAAISGLIDGEMVFKDLSSEFTNLQKLVDKLGGTARREHYVLVQFETDATGLISVGRGKLDGVYSAPDGSVLTREEAIREMLHQVQTTPAVINVYQASDKTRGEQMLDAIPVPPQPERPRVTPPPEPVVAAPAPGLNELEGAPQSPAAPSPAPESAQAEISELVEEVEIPETVAPRFVPKVPAPPPLEFDAPQIETPSKPAPETTAAAATALALEIAAPASMAVAEPRAEGEARSFDELVPLMAEVIAVVERASVGMGRDNGDFNLALKEGLLEVTDDFPFLDPFAAELEYQSGQLEFVGKAGAVEFVAGVSGALRACVRNLAARRSDKTMVTRVRESLIKLQETRRREFDRYGLGILISTIAE